MVLAHKSLAKTARQAPPATARVGLQATPVLVLQAGAPCGAILAWLQVQPGPALSTTPILDVQDLEGGQAADFAARQDADDDGHGRVDAAAVDAEADAQAFLVRQGLDREDFDGIAAETGDGLLQAHE